MVAGSPCSGLLSAWGSHLKRALAVVGRLRSGLLFRVFPGWFQGGSRVVPGWFGGSRVVPGWFQGGWFQGGSKVVPERSQVVPGWPGGSRVVPGWFQVVPERWFFQGGSRAVPSGSQVVPGWSQVVPGWFQGGGCPGGSRWSQVIPGWFQGGSRLARARVNVSHDSQSLARGTDAYLTPGLHPWQ